MKKTMVYLQEDIHEGLRKLAFDRRESMAALIRRAVEFCYAEVIEDVRDMEAEMEEYRRDPSTSIRIEEYIAKRNIRVPSRPKASRPARSRAPAKA